MRTLFITLAATALLGTTAVAGQPAGDGGRRMTQTICLDVGGEQRPAICRGSGSRIDQTYDICTCEDAQRVEAPICASGEKPQSENRVFELARKDAARDGSLVGDSFEGRSMCVKARNS